MVINAIDSNFVNEFLIEIVLYFDVRILGTKKNLSQRNKPQTKPNLGVSDVVSTDGKLEEEDEKVGDGMCCHQVRE